MKSATLSLFASALLALSLGAGVLTACADSSSDPIPNTGSSTSNTDPADGGAAAPAATGGNGGGGSQPKACAPSCKADTDCANSCGAISGAVWCCDTKMSQCYSTKAAMCPAQTDPANDDAGSMAAY
jgi:hypothetical protein